MPKRISICVAVLAAVAAASVALAEGRIPGPDGVIHACRRVDGGRLRAVAARVKCRAGERALRWNVQGVAGPAGPQGPQGEPGPGLGSFEDLAGLPCTAGANEGTTEVSFDASSGEARIRCAVAAPPPAQVRINEFSTGVEGALTDEFVEIHNAGSSAVDLSGYKLVYRSAAGTSDVSLGALPDGTTLAPGAFMLFGGSGYAGAHPADRSFSTSLASSGGGLGLRDRPASSSTRWRGARRRTPSSRAPSLPRRPSPRRPGSRTRAIPTETTRTTTRRTSRRATRRRVQGIRQLGTRSRRSAPSRRFDTLRACRERGANSAQLRSS
jgi:Lamin Tail Domain